MIHELVQLDNADFFKRSLTRYIAIRLDDFIKIGRRLNNAGLNEQAIRVSLNELEQFYNEFFKTQRDKMGAHFQHVDYAERLEYWQDINFDHSNFFSSQAKTIYELFAADPNYQPPVCSFLTDDAKEVLTRCNARLNFEKKSTFSGDILVHTRPNTGGMLHQDGLQAKAGTLKAIELLVHYDREIWHAVTEPLLKRTFTKLFIVDVMSYADNLFTRMDVQPGSAQDEAGLDHYLVPPLFIEQEQIIKAFKAVYQLTNTVQSLRSFRNTIGGHIDVSLPLSTIERQLDDFDFGHYEAFYDKMRGLFSKLCHTGPLLLFFAIDPYESISDVMFANRPNLRTFDGSPVPNPAQMPQSADDEAEYQTNWDRYLQLGDLEMANYFVDRFLRSEIVHHSFQVEEQLAEGGLRYHYYQVRRIHQFFEMKLADLSSPETERAAIANLFIKGKRGFPGLLAYYLMHNWPTEPWLQFAYLVALSHLTSHIPEKYLIKYQQFYLVDGLPVKSEVLKAFLRYHIKERLNQRDAAALAPSRYTIFIDQALNDSIEPFETLALASALYAELHLVEYSTQPLKVFDDKLIPLITSSLHQVLSSLESEYDPTLENKAIDFLISNRPGSFIALIAEAFYKSQQNALGNKLNDFILNGIVIYNRADFIDIRNITFLLYKRERSGEAISIGRQLIQRNPDSKELVLHIMRICAQDKQYRDELESLRTEVKNHYQLSPADIDEIDSW